MNKNTVLIINLTSENLMKAIYNAIAINLLDIILIGDRKIIYSLCKNLNYNINLLQIVDCTDKVSLYNIIDKYKNEKNIQGIIIDDKLEGNLFHYIKTNKLCKIIDYTIFNKSIFLIGSNDIKNLKEVIKIINQLNIYTIKIAIISSNKHKTNSYKDLIRKEINYLKIDVINKNKIKKCKYNIIIFDDKIEELQYINDINNKTLIRIIDIKKTSKTFVFDASNKQLKTIFLQLLFLSKLNSMSFETYTQIM